MASLWVVKVRGGDEDEGEGAGHEAYGQMDWMVGKEDGWVERNVRQGHVCFEVAGLSRRLHC